VAALAGSGLASDQILFAGFLPARANARRAKLEKLRAHPATLIFYEAPHRIAATLRDAADVLGDRPAVVARELTKIHEEFVRGRLRELAGRFSQQAARGELVLVIGGAGDKIHPESQITATDQLAERIRALEAEGDDPKTALKKAARELGLKRDEAYRLWESQKNRRSR
jgi:16S rRNA (cytidine1402-2'-O)-methyltransferase